MPRLKLNPLCSYAFITEIAVRITDLNYGGHLGNDRLLSIIHEARYAFLSNHGYSERDCDGCSLILGDTAVVYYNEAFRGDVLRIEVSASEPTRCGFRIFYRVSRKGDNTLIALVENGMVCFDYTVKEIQPLPESVKTKLISY
jgi:acyl-CoA thioesterase FadM